MASGKEISSGKMAPLKRARDPEDSDGSSGAGSVFDEETGALTRPYKSFRPPSDMRKRGYGRTRALDQHPFLRPQISLVTAPTGSGKTTLLLNILDEIMEHANPSKLGRIMFYTGSPGDPLLRRLDKESVDVYGPDKVETLLSDLRNLNVYDETGKALSPAGGSGGGGAPDELPENKRPLHVLVLDDAANNKDLTPTNAKGSEIGDVLVSHRHRGLHVIFSTQKFNMVPTFARANATHIFAFPGSPQENKQVFSGLPMGTEQLEQTMKKIGRIPHQFLWVNTKQRTAMEGFTKVVLQ